jgi:Na+/H+ antiporter NhaD/arsenite permease-like protein
MQPIIYYFSVATSADPIPFLSAEFTAANIWSMLLFVGNPTNIIVAMAYNLSFVEYSRWMALPTVAAVLLVLHIQHLPKRLTLPDIEPAAMLVDKLGAVLGSVNMLVCLGLLAGGPSMGWELWVITLVCAGLHAVYKFVAYVVLRGSWAARKGHKKAASRSSRPCSNGFEAEAAGSSGAAAGSTGAAAGSTEAAAGSTGAAAHRCHQQQQEQLRKQGQHDDGNVGGTAGDQQLWAEKGVQLAAATAAEAGTSCRTGKCAIIGDGLKRQCLEPQSLHNTQQLQQSGQQQYQWKCKTPQFSDGPAALVLDDHPSLAAGEEVCQLRQQQALDDGPLMITPAAVSLAVSLSKWWRRLMDTLVAAGSAGPAEGGAADAQVSIRSAAVDDRTSKSRTPAQLGPDNSRTPAQLGPDNSCHERLQSTLADVYLPTPPDPADAQEQRLPFPTAACDLSTCNSSSSSSSDWQPQAASSADAIMRQLQPHELSFWRILAVLPWEVIPFVLGMFVLVQCLSDNGWIDRMATWLGAGAAGSAWSALFAVGAVSLVLANIINNQPMTILMTRVCMSPAFIAASASAGSNAADGTTGTHTGPPLASALSVVVASNVAANFTVMGALAGIMFLSILQSRGMKRIGYLQFTKLMLPAGVASTIMALLVLGAEMQRKYW